MRTTGRRALLIAALLVAAPWPWAPLDAAAQERPRADRRVALTFDDLPTTTRACDRAYAGAVTRALTGTLAARALPAAGLVTPGRACRDAALLRETLARWLEVGAILGNHTATHPDINTTPTAEYLADVDRGAALIEAAVGATPRWFRPPYLHSGPDARKKRALAAHLAANGYRVAVVTVDNQEWVYAAVYDDARARGDTALARRVVDGYLLHLEESFAFYEDLSRAVFGREIPQVLLLHANRLNADQLGHVVDLLAGRGYRFISMPEALSDPAYSRDDTYVGPRGLSWIQRWALEDGVPVPDEPREAPWVAAALRAISQRRND